MNTTIEQFRDGAITATQALRTLLDDNAECEAAFSAMEARRKELRGYIEEVVGALGGKAEVAGVAEVVITQATQVKSYDKKALDALVIELAARGYGDIAGEIANCAKETARAGSLRITPAKEGKR